MLVCQAHAHPYTPLLLVASYHRRRKVVKLGGANRQEIISMVKDKMVSTLRIRWCCSPIAPPFLPPMTSTVHSLPGLRGGHQSLQVAI